MCALPTVEITAASFENCRFNTEGCSAPASFLMLRMNIHFLQIFAQVAQKHADILFESGSVLSFIHSVRIRFCLKLNYLCSVR